MAVPSSTSKLAVVALVALGIGAARSHAQQVPGTPAPPAATSPGWTSDIDRAPRQQRPEPAPAQLALSAQLSDDTAQLDNGLIWRVYRAQAEEDGTRRPVHQSRDAQPVLRVEPGSYVVTVGYGRASITRRVTVEAGRTTTEKFVINAGGLRVSALLANGEAASERLVSFDILSDERDQSGARAKIATGLKPGVLIRLNAGIYHVVSTYGDANAIARADITIEPGRLSEVKVTHQAARVTFKLVAAAGGEAIPDAQWSIVNVQGEVVKESVGALPTHVLAPGLYAVGARHAGISYRKEFTIAAGEAQTVEVTMN
ncbi:MAG: hypothetical protein RL291_476 [Pseudomonadota bacterium]